MISATSRDPIKIRHCISTILIPNWPATILSAVEWSLSTLKHDHWRLPHLTPSIATFFTSSTMSSGSAQKNKFTDNRKVTKAHVSAKETRWAPVSSSQGLREITWSRKSDAAPAATRFANSSLASPNLSLIRCKSSGRKEVCVLNWGNDSPTECASVPFNFSNTKQNGWNLDLSFGSKLVILAPQLWRRSSSPKKANILLRMWGSARDMQM